MAVNNSTIASRYWVVVPAAGSGRRMGSDTPKQYLSIQGKPVIAHTIERLMQVSQLAGMVIVLSPNDSYWSTITLNKTSVSICTVAGGEERADSVNNALHFLSERAQPDDWVLVHDAARPCVRVDDIQQLIEKVSRNEVGGILAIPVRDTMKRVDESNHITATVDRHALWHALTPQMFRLGMLQTALNNAKQQNINVTDEAMAIELLGHRPIVVEGCADNIKITRKEDLVLAAFYLQQQG